jgi:hypothetical protein
VTIIKSPDGRLNVAVDRLNFTVELSVDAVAVRVSDPGEKWLVRRR